MPPHHVYDDIIVGAGSAGCVLAPRLTEAPSTRGLLLEAGAPDRPLTLHMPAAFSTFCKSRDDWAYDTGPQLHLQHRRLSWLRGKVLGGSRAIKAMISTRGHPSADDHWHALGNPGWRFSEVLPSVTKGEHHEGRASAYHGIGGPLHVADLRCTKPLLQACIAAGVELGLPRNEDFHGPDHEGVGWFQVTPQGGQRQSAATADRKPAGHRRHLTICTHAHVGRVLCDRRQAVGVLSREDGHPRRLQAPREVLRCAGAVHAPQVLMVAGIGHAEHRRRLGLAVVMDLPGVGQHVPDHRSVAVACACRQPVRLAGAGTVGHLVRYRLRHHGPLTSNSAAAGGVGKLTPTAPAPDLPRFCAPAYGLNHGVARPAGYGFTVVAAWLGPHSRGWITLASSDPFAPPVRHPAYLREAPDRQARLEGRRRCRRLTDTTAVESLRGPEIAPGAAAPRDAARIDAIRHTAATCDHPVGPGKMGQDALAVVDPALRVHGSEGLRVVDASIRPTSVRGTTHAPTVMSAERAAVLSNNGSSAQGRESPGVSPYRRVARCGRVTWHHAAGDDPGRGHRDHAYPQCHGPHWRAHGVGHDAPVQALRGRGRGDRRRGQSGLHRSAGIDLRAQVPRG